MNLEPYEIVVLDLLLEHIPYYGEFSLIEGGNKLRKSRPELQFSEMHGSTEARIFQFLTNNGYANEVPARIKELFFVIVLTERGRALKETGSLSTYNDYQIEKKLKKKEAEERAIILEKATIENLQTQTVLLSLNRRIAIATIVQALAAVLTVFSTVIGGIGWIMSLKLWTTIFVFFCRCCNRCDFLLINDRRSKRHKTTN